MENTDSILFSQATHTTSQLPAAVRIRLVSTVSHSFPSRLHFKRLSFTPPTAVTSFSTSMYMEGSELTWRVNALWGPGMGSFSVGAGTDKHTVSFSAVRAAGDWTDRDMGMSRESFRGRPFFFFSTVSTSSSSFRLEREEDLATGIFSSLSLLLSRRSRGLNSFARFCSFNLSTAVGVTLVRTGAPGVALDRSVNRESNAFMGSILDGVVNTEGDDAAGAEVAFTLSLLTELPAGLVPAAAAGSVEGFEVPKELGVLASSGSSCGLL